jgi:hypothetical protein
MRSSGSRRAESYSGCQATLRRHRCSHISSAGRAHGSFPPIRLQRGGMLAQLGRCQPGPPAPSLDAYWTPWYAAGHRPTGATAQDVDARGGKRKRGPDLGEHGCQGQNVGSADQQ